MIIPKSQRKKVKSWDNILTWILWCSHFNFLQNQTKLRTLNAKEHFPSQSSSYFLRRLQKIFSLTVLIVTTKEAWKILSHFCGLFQKNWNFIFYITQSPLSVTTKWFLSFWLIFLPTSKNSTLWSSLEWPALWRITMNSLHNEGIYKWVN